MHSRIAHTLEAAQLCIGQRFIYPCIYCINREKLLQRSSRLQLKQVYNKFQLATGQVIREAGVFCLCGYSVIFAALYIYFSYRKFICGFCMLCTSYAQRRFIYILYTRNSPYLYKYICGMYRIRVERRNPVYKRYYLLYGIFAKVTTEESLPK